jgi:hypothetical protein
MNRQNNSGGAGNGESYLNLVEEIKSILVSKLKSNLMRYQAPYMISGALNQAEQHS